MMKKFIWILILGMLSVSSYASVNLVIIGSKVPTSMTAGNTYTVSYTVKNIGSTSTGTTFNVAIFVSPGSVFTPGVSKFVGQGFIFGLGANVSTTLTTTITIPADYPSGAKYIIAGVDGDNVVYESGGEGDNNYAQSVLIKGIPELNPLAFHISTSSAAAGNNITAYFAVNNDGGYAAGSFNVGFYITNSPILVLSNSTYLGGYFVSSVPALGQTILLNQNLSLPSNLCPGDYYIHIWVDNFQAVSEKDDQNNFAHVPINISGASTPAAPSVKAATNNTQTGFQLNWNQSAGAAGYKVDLSTDSFFSNLIYNNVDVGNVTSRSVNGLNCNMTYYFRVRAYNSCGNNSSNSSQLPVSTLSCSCAPPFITSQPQNSSLSGGTTNTSFSVNASGGTQPYTYQWQVSTNGGGNWFDINTSGSSPAYSNWTTATLNLSGITQADNNYQYKCIVYSGYPCGSASVSSNPAVLSTMASCNLPATVVTQPTVIASSSCTGHYQVVSGNNVTYIIQVSTDEGFYNIINSFQSTGGSVNIVGLSPQTSYYYRVYYTLDGCTSAFSPGFPFTTQPYVDNLKPVSSFTTSANQIDAGGIVQFNGFSTSPPTLSWSWSFPGGNPAASNAQTPSVTYNTPGTYRVTLTTQNANGYSDPYTQIGFINVRPTASTPAKIPPQAAAKDNSNQYLSSEPVQVGTGSYAYKHTDLNVHVVGGSLQFTRFYNSLNAAADGPLGYGWSHTYNYHLVNQQDTLWNLQYPDGHHELFVPVFNGGGDSFALYTGNFDKLHKNSGGDFTLSAKDNHKYHFNASGQLDQVTDLNNNITTLTYSGNDLITVTGPGGRTLSFTYNNGKIITVADPLNRQVNFGYDAVGTMHYVSSANGPFTYFTYDPEHRLLSIGNPLGVIVVTNVYDAAGRVKHQTDADSKSTTFTYDTPGIGDAVITNPDNSQVFVHHDTLYRKTFIKDELGFTQSFAYDMNSDVTQYTNQNNITATRTYDLAGNLLTEALPGGITNAITYNTFNSPVQLTDPKGNNAVISYDGSDNPQSIQLPDNTVQNYTNYPNGLRHTLQDGRGNITTLTYSGEGDLVASAAPAGTKNYEYDLAGRLTAVTDENGNKTNITYDNNDNITGIKNAAGRSSTFTYDVAGQLTAVTDRKGNMTSFAYDRKGRLISKTNAAQGITKYTYDVMDNLESVTDPAGRMVKFGYDKLRRKTSVTNASGTTQYKYDGVGNLLQATDATNKTTAYTYSATNKVKTAADGLSNTTVFSYDLNDNLMSVTDAANKATVYAYDAMNRLVSVLDAANNTTKITYDENGNRKTVQDPNGHVQTFTWNAANRLSGLRDAAGNNFGYGYDAAGNNIRIDKPTGSITKNYDLLNRLTSVNNSTGNNYSFTYDDNDNIISAASNTGTSALEYNNLDQLTQYTDPYASKVLFSYDAAGNKNLVTYPGDKSVSYSYNGNNQLSTVKDWLGHTFTYTYDAAGRPAKLLYPNGTHCDYTFDDAARLTTKKTLAAGNSIITSSVFALDAVGNRTAEQRSGPIPANLVPAAKVYAYSDDDAMQNDSTWTFTNDNSGNRIKETKGGVTASYNFAVDNRLDSYTDTTGRNTTFAYDAWGNRLGRSVDNSVNRYVLDISDGMSKVLQITDGSGNITSQYVYGAGLLERVDATGNALYYHYDAQHNTTALSDANGIVQDKYTYDPFGTMLTHEGNTDQPFTFLGEYGVERESNSLYYNRARYYDAANGRFLSKDEFPSVLSNPQSLNRYIYGIDNPGLNYDPNGLFSWSSLGIAGLQLLVAAGDVATVALEVTALPESAILGTSTTLSSLNSLNDATKNFRAVGINIKNAFKGNTNWTDADDVKGALDYVGFDNPNVQILVNANSVFQGALGVKDFFGKEVPANLVNILTSNYSNEEKLGYLSNYIIKRDSPIFMVADYIDGLDGLEKLIRSINSNSCGK